MNFLRIVFLAFLLHIIGVDAMIRGFLRRRRDSAIQRQDSSSITTSSPSIPWNTQSAEAVKNACARFAQTLMAQTDYSPAEKNWPYAYIMSLPVINPNINLQPQAYQDPSNPTRVRLVTTDTSAFDPANFLRSVQYGLNVAMDLLQQYEQRTGTSMTRYVRVVSLMTVCRELKRNSFPDYPPEFIKEALFRFFTTLDAVETRVSAGNFLRRRKTGAARRQTSSSLTASSSRVPWNQQSGEAVKTACAQFIATIMQHMGYQVNHPGSPYTVVMSLRVINPNVNITPHAFMDPAAPGEVRLVTTDTSAFAADQFLVTIKEALNVTLDTLDTYDRKNPHRKMPTGNRAEALMALCHALRTNSFPDYPPERIKEVLVRFYKTLGITPTHRRDAFLEFYRGAA